MFAWRQPWLEKGAAQSDGVVGQYHWMLHSFERLGVPLNTFAQHSLWSQTLASRFKLVAESAGVRFRHIVVLGLRFTHGPSGKAGEMVEPLLDDMDTLQANGGDWLVIANLEKLEEGRRAQKAG